jgi:hypothetical protein
MRKKAIFSNKNISEKYYVVLYKDKLISYYGVSNSRFFEENIDKPKQFQINQKFKIFKLDKYDKIEHNVNATHILINERLEFILGNIPVYLKLNQLEIFKIKWHKKEYIIQSLDFKKSILTGLFGAILGSLVTMVFQSNQSVNNAPTIPPKQEIINHLNEDDEKSFKKKLTNDSIK